MKKNCEYCKENFAGRADKRFCSVKCKNDFNNAARKNTKEITAEIDAYLHRNREILATLMGDATKETFDKLVLTRTGFKYEFMTGIYTNKEGKMYKYIYDYAWLDFSDQKILIVKKSKK
jgi:hypothetical protein